MKNFDLEAAKRGAAVCTRGGYYARIVCFDSIVFSCGDANPIIAELITSGELGVRTFSDKGEWVVGGECEDDLMMRDDDYLEKLERGEYGNHIVDANEMVEPTCNEPIPPDREYWRRVYAGQAMQGEISGYLAAGEGFNGDKSIPGIIAKSSVMIADALIAELEKTQKK